MASQNICLIGGGGFLGTSFRDNHHADYNKIIILGRSVEIGKLRSNEIYHSISTLSVKKVADILVAEDVDAVIDLSYNTVPKSSFENPITDFTENLYSVIHHLEIMRLLPGARFVYISSGGTIYGNSPNQVPILEEHLNVPLSPYGITKLTSERYILMYKEIYGLDTVIVRPSNIYGPGQKPFKGQGFIATAIALALQGQSIQVFGNGSHVRDYIYKDDFCAILKGVIEKGGNGEIYNVGFGKGYSINEVIEIVNSNPKANTLKVNYLADRPFDVHYNVLNNQKITGLLDILPVVDLEKGIESTFNWIENYLKD